MKRLKYSRMLLCLSLIIALSACGKKDAPAVTTTPTSEPTGTTAPPETTVPPTTSVPSYEISIGMTMEELRGIMGSDGERLNDSVPRYSWTLADGRVLTVSLTRPTAISDFPWNWLVSEFKLDNGKYFQEPFSIMITPAAVVPPTIPESCEISLGMTHREISKIMGSDGILYNHGWLGYEWELADGSTLIIVFDRPGDDAPRPVELPAEWLATQFWFGSGTPFFTEPSTITVSPAQPDLEE